MWHHIALHTPSCGNVLTKTHHRIEVGHLNMSAVEPPSSSAAAAPAPREFYYFDVTFYFSLIFFLYDEGVPNRRGVDLSLVVTLYGVFYILVFSF